MLYYLCAFACLSLDPVRTQTHVNFDGCRFPFRVSLPIISMSLSFIQSPLPQHDHNPPLFYGPLSHAVPYTPTLPQLLLATADFQFRCSEINADRSFVISVESLTHLFSSTLPNGMCLLAQYCVEWSLQVINVQGFITISYYRSTFQVQGCFKSQKLSH